MAQLEVFFCCESRGVFLCFFNIMLLYLLVVSLCICFGRRYSISLEASMFENLF